MHSPSGRPVSELYSSSAYRWYALIVLMLVFVCHGMDRALPTILMEPIRHEFGLNDSQLGAVGMAYGLGFGAAVLPMGMLSDRLGRRNVLTIILVLWSLCTAFGAATRNFVQLLLVRLGVGLFEAGGTPAAVPMLADIFPPEQRSFAQGALYASASIGTILAGVLGGYVAAEMGWRAAFLAAGLPGVLIAIILFTTVREPVLGGSERVGDVHPEAESAQPAPTLVETLVFLVRSPGLILVIAGFIVATLVAIVMSVWAGSFFVRVHGLGVKEIGLLIGIGSGVSSIVSSMGSGWLADRLAPGSATLNLRIVWISLLLSFAGSMAMLFSPQVGVAIAGYIVADFTRSNYPPLIYAVAMTSTPPRMRGMVMSIMQLLAVLVGFGVGPIMIGFLSDLYGGGTAVRYAMMNANLLLLIVVVLLILGSRLLARSLAHSRLEAAT